MTARRSSTAALAAAGAVVTALAGTPAAAQQVGGTVSIETPLADDAYIAGGSITLRAEAAGDVVAAGGRILLDGRIGGDVNAAGGVIDLFGAVADDARLAGGTLTVGAALGGDLIAAGGSVSVLRDAAVAGRAWLGGGSVEVAGRIGRGLSATAGEVVIDGTVEGDAHVAARRLRVGPAARIAGDLTYRSPEEAVIDAGARIAGTVRRLPYERSAGPGIGPAIGLVGGLWLLGLIVTGGALVVAFPGPTARLAATVQEAPGRCAAVGFALLAALPLAALICLVIVIAVPLGLALVALYLAALLAAYLTGALWLGERALSRLGGARAGRTWWRAGALAAALIVISAVGWIPVLGWLVALATVVLGFGALGLQLHRMARGRSAAMDGPSAGT